MSQVQEIEIAIESLSRDDYTRLREWFLERDWIYWDRQIEMDSQSGKLDFLVEEAFAEKKQGRLYERIIN